MSVIGNRSGLVRPAKPTDAAGIARVHVASWRTTYPGMVPDRYLVALSPLSHAARWRAMLGGGRTAPGVGSPGQTTQSFPGQNNGGPAPSAQARGRATYVATDPEHGVVGFGTCGPQRTALDGFGGEIYAIYLYDFAQNMGFGRKLMASMAVDLIGSGHRSACVWVLRDNPARWFYERLGATRVAEQAITFAGTNLTEVAYGWRDLTVLARQSMEPRVP